MMKDEISIPRQIDLKLFLPLLVTKEKEKTVPLNATHSITAALVWLGKTNKKQLIGTSEKVTVTATAQ